ncbi:MAG: DUF1289 domain-containing protein [bacterium]
MEKIESPCVKNCELNFKTKLCKGCLRTMDEITGWGLFSEKQKEKVLKLIAARRADVNEYK